MISNLSYWNDAASLPMDFISQDEYNQYAMMDDDTIKNEIFSSPDSDHDRFQASSSSPNNASQQFLMADLVCGVCGAPASGYNFDQITCESCKAFFRRNALRNSPNLKCRFTGSCIINPQTRRQCTYCRLKKCFAINMRKDWIRTEEEVELRKLSKEQKKMNKLSRTPQPLLNLPIVVRKKKRLLIKLKSEDQLVQSIYTLNCFGSNEILSDDHRTVLNNITNAYQLGADKADYSHVDKYSPDTSFCQFLNDEIKMHGSLIWFYKSIPSFRQLDLDDQILLIKCNLINIIHLHHIIVQHFQDNPKIGEHMSKWIDPDFHQQMAQTRRYFYRFTKYPLLLKLTLTVFIFSINLSIPDGSSQFNDYKNRKTLYECQNHYTTILWRYLTHLFEEKEAIRAIGIIVTQILRYQNLMLIMKRHVPSSSNHDVLHELMQSLFGLS